LITCRLKVGNEFKLHPAKIRRKWVLFLVNSVGISNP
jgi:hypothetical protein